MTDFNNTKIFLLVSIFEELRRRAGELIKYFGEKNWTENYFLSYKLFCGSSPINHVIM